MPQATSEALAGLGMPVQLAALAGANPVTQSGVGTSQSGATVLRSKSVELNTTGGNTAFVMNAEVGVNEPVFVFNSSSTSALVFCPVGQTLNGSSNASLTVAQNKGAYFWQYKKGFWCSVLSA